MELRRRRGVRLRGAVLATSMLKARGMKASPARAQGPTGRRDAQRKDRRQERGERRQTWAGQPAQAARRILRCAHRHISSNQELNLPVQTLTGIETCVLPGIATICTCSIAPYRAITDYCLANRCRSRRPADQAYSAAERPVSYRRATGGREPQ